MGSTVGDWAESRASASRAIAAAAARDAAERAFSVERAEWEAIQAEYDVRSTHRMRVPGGWLVRVLEHEPDQPNTTTMCYVPDPGHTWDI